MHSTSSSLQLVHGAPCSTTLQRTFLARQHWQAFEARRLTVLKGAPLLVALDGGALLFWPATCGGGVVAAGAAATVAAAAAAAAAAVLLSLAGAAGVSDGAMAVDGDGCCSGSGRLRRQRPMGGAVRCHGSQRNSAGARKCDGGGGDPGQREKKKRFGPGGRRRVGADDMQQRATGSNISGAGTGELGHSRHRRRPSAVSACCRCIISRHTHEGAEEAAPCPTGAASAKWRKRLDVILRCNLSLAVRRIASQRRASQRRASLSPSATRFVLPVRTGWGRRGAAFPVAQRERETRGRIAPARPRDAGAVESGGSAAAAAAAQNCWPSPILRPASRTGNCRALRRLPRDGPMTCLQTAAAHRGLENLREFHRRQPAVCVGWCETNTCGWLTSTWFGLVMYTCMPS